MSRTMRSSDKSHLPVSELNISILKYNSTVLLASSPVFRRLFISTSSQPSANMFARNGPPVLCAPEGRESRGEGLSQGDVYIYIYIYVNVYM